MWDTQTEVGLQTTLRLHQICHGTYDTDTRPSTVLIIRSIGGEKLVADPQVDMVTFPEKRLCIYYDVQSFHAFGHSDARRAR